MESHNKIDWPIEEMKEWYESGMTLQQIGDRLGRRLQTVGRVLKRAGVQMRPRGWCDQSGPKNRFWRGGRTVDKHGYVLVYRPDHPFANSHGQVREHRLVAEQMLGRYLEPTEVVHHKDDDPSNNDPDNLMVYESNSQHLAETLKGKVPRWTEEGRRRTLEGARRPRRRTASPGPSEFDDDLLQQMYDQWTESLDISLLCP
jgi:HNH endonuclease